MATISALEALRQGQTYYRIFEQVTESTSYNIDVTPNAIAIGPDSELDKIPVVYYDADDTNLQKVITVGVGSPFVSRVEARMNQVLRNGTTPGRITIATAPSVSVSSGSRRIDANLGSPYLDLILYYNTPAELPRVRSPYILTSAATLSASPTTVFTIPYYGRKRFSLTLYNTSGAIAISSWVLYGYRCRSASTNIQYNISPGSGGAANTIATSGTASFVLTDARYDYLQLVATPASGAPSLAYSFEASDE